MNLGSRNKRVFIKKKEALNKDQQFNKILSAERDKYFVVEKVVDLGIELEAEIKNSDLLYFNQMQYLFKNKLFS